MTKRKLSELILDYNIYPRSEVDGNAVRYLRQAFEAGEDIPPVHIDKKSLRVTDGFHRVTMYRQVFKKEPDHEIDVVEKSYRSEGDLFLDCARMNARHGRQLTRFDRTHCILIAEKLEVPVDEIASALAMTVDQLGKLRADRVGELRVGKSREDIPLKRSIRHMSGETISKAQNEVNDKLSGMNQAFHANQLIMLIESGLLDKDDEKLMMRLRVLSELLDGLLTVKVE